MTHTGADAGMTSSDRGLLQKIDASSALAARPQGWFLLPTCLRVRIFYFPPLPLASHAARTGLDPLPSPPGTWYLMRYAACGQHGVSGPAGLGRAREGREK